MLLSDVKRAIKKKTERSYKLPDDDILALEVYEALLWVCTQCEPSVLLRRGEIENSEKLLRQLDGGDFLVFPDMPSFEDTTSHLMIDELLVFAVINFTCFALSGEDKFKALADVWMFSYKRNDMQGFAGEEIEDD